MNKVMENTKTFVKNISVIWVYSCELINWGPVLSIAFTSLRETQNLEKKKKLEKMFDFTTESHAMIDS